MTYAKATPFTTGGGGGGGGTWGSITGTLSDQTDLNTALNNRVIKNSSITGATKTKITYDAKGLVTSGADATTADIADSSDKRYVTDAQLTVIGNTSGTNTGDQTSVSGNSGSTDALKSATTTVNVSSATAPTSGQVLTATSGSSATWQTPSTGMTNPMTTGGDIIYGGASGTPTRLANGSSGQMLTSSGGTSAPTWSAGTTTATASTVAGRDANGNLVAVNHLDGVTSTATAAGTTTLTVASTYRQTFTGSTTQNCRMPVATTLANGQSWYIVNNSSGVVTVQSSGANTIQAMAAGSSCLVTCINTAGGTGTASWNWDYNPATSGTQPIANGGTGQTTANAGFNALSPMTTGGDLIYGGASGVATRLANGSSGQVLTSSGGTSAPTWQTPSAGGVSNDPNLLLNVGLSTSVAANALTIRLKQADGSTDPSTGTSAVKVAFRSGTNTSGAVIERSITSAKSIVIPSGATLGFNSGIEDYIYVYLHDDGSGNISLAVSASQNMNEGVRYNPATLASSADDAAEFYSDGTGSGPVRLIGRILVSATTAGSWDSAGTRIEVGNNIPKTSVKSMSSNFIPKHNTIYTVEGSSGDITATLPVYYSNFGTGHTFTIINKGPYNVLINDPIGDEIDGMALVDKIIPVGASCSVIYDGYKWLTYAENNPRSLHALFSVEEDFCGLDTAETFTTDGYLTTNNVYKWRAEFTGTGASITAALIASDNAVGVIALETGTTSTGETQLLGSGAANGDGGVIEFETRIYLPDLSTVAQEFTILAGFSSGGTTADLYEACVFQYLRTTSVNWRYRTFNSTNTSASSSVAVVEDTWINLRIKLNQDAATADFYINGTHINQVSTDLPTFSPMVPFVQITKSAGTTERSVVVDYITFKKYFSTVR